MTGPCVHDPKIHYIIGDQVILTCDCGLCGENLDDLYKDKLDSFYTFLTTGKTPRMIEAERNDARRGS